MRAPMPRPVALVGHVAAEDRDVAGLDLADAGDQAPAAPTCRRRRDRSRRPCSRAGTAIDTSSSAMPSAVAMRDLLDPATTSSVIAGASLSSSFGQRSTGWFERSPCRCTPVFAWRWYFFSTRGSILQLDAEHQLLALVGGLDALGRELRVRCDEADIGRDRRIWAAGRP